MSATASLSTLDTESLLTPIHADEPSGRDLRYEGTYDQIREVRRDEGDLPQGVWETDAKRADWVRVSELCTDAVTNKSKDLQIAAWLLEAWMNIHGFAGVAAGFELLTSLLDRYWETVYPRADDGDLEYRASPFTWINEKLDAELKLIPFVFPEGQDARQLSWADWELASFNAAAVSRNTNAKNSLSQDDFQRALHLTPSDILGSQFLAIHAALSACSKTQEILDKKFGPDAPSLRKILSVLEKIHAFLGAFTHQSSSSTLIAMAEAVAVDSVPEASEAPLQPSAPVAVVPHPEVGPIASRAEAYHWLAAAAEFLSRTEPHSPTPYLIRRAIRWGNMSLEDLLPELVRNQSELTEITQLLQIGR